MSAEIRSRLRFGQLLEVGEGNLQMYLGVQTLPRPSHVGVMTGMVGEDNITLNPQGFGTLNPDNITEVLEMPPLNVFEVIVAYCRGCSKYSQRVFVSQLVRLWKFSNQENTSSHHTKNSSSTL